MNENKHDDSIPIEPPMILKMELDPRPSSDGIVVRPPIVPAPTPEAESAAAQTTPAESMDRSAALPETPNGGGLWNYVVPSMFLTSMALLVVYVVPYLFYHWRMMDAQADAEGLLLKRRAELKAEAEHADERLELLDKKVNLVGLGFREVSRKIAPVVVNVANLREPLHAEELVGRKKMLIYDPETDRRYLQHGIGSGVLLKPGVILTNYHVVRGAHRLRVVFASGQSIGLNVNAVSADDRTDLAVLRLPDNLADGLKEDASHTAVFADSDKDVHVGDWALAMGSPHGLRQTVTQGIISAKGRLLPMLDLVELLQTDAAINPGNSGGPLFDQLGRVVGINVAIATDNGGNQGIGFAIPSNVAKKIAEQLVEHGEVPRGYIGIAMEDLPGPRAKALKLQNGGVLIREVLVGEAGEKAGLKVGDIILRINKEEVSRFEPMHHFRQLIANLPPAAEVTLDILRGVNRMNITVTLGKRPANLR